MRLGVRRIFVVMRNAWKWDASDDQKARLSFCSENFKNLTESKFWLQNTAKDWFRSVHMY